MQALMLKVGSITIVPLSDGDFSVAGDPTDIYYILRK
jgi:hypothetical protein